MTTLGQALRNAIEAERAAARYYGALVARAQDDETRAFFEQMKAAEEGHAAALERRGERNAEVKLPWPADEKVHLVETSPGWEDVATIGLDRAITTAIEAEHHAALFYDAMVDFSSGELADLFRDLAEQEEQHALRLDGLLARLRRRSDD